jgi:hypothetical protein
MPFFFIALWVIGILIACVLGFLAWLPVMVANGIMLVIFLSIVFVTMQFTFENTIAPIKAQNLSRWEEKQRKKAVEEKFDAFLETVPDILESVDSEYAAECTKEDYEAEIRRAIAGKPPRTGKEKFMRKKIEPQLKNLGY